MARPALKRDDFARNLLCLPAGFVQWFMRRLDSREYVILWGGRAPTCAEAALLQDNHCSWSPLQCTEGVQQSSSHNPQILLLSDSPRRAQTESEAGALD